MRGLKLQKDTVTAFLLSDKKGREDIPLHGDIYILLISCFGHMVIKSILNH